MTDPSTFTFGTVTDTYWNRCHGPYETKDTEYLEASDAFCYPVGDTHGALNTAPDEVSGCQDDVFQNGDLDFDGTSYWADWPIGPTPTATFPDLRATATYDRRGQYSQFYMQTDTALSESTCETSGHGCGVPAPIGPGHFYPYWTRVTGSSSCSLEFGNVSTGAGVNDFGGDASYGTDMQSTLGYPEIDGPAMSNACDTVKRLRHA